YSLADLHACVEGGGAEYFRRHFADKVVIVGSALDVEDRRFPAKRFAVGGAGASPPERCRIPLDPDRFGQVVVRRSIPGALIHAAAVNTLLRGDALVRLDRAGTFAATAASGTLLAILFFLLAPAPGALAVLGVLAAEGGIAAVAFRHGTVAPIIALGLEAAYVFAAVYAFRFVVEDRIKRRIKRAFEHFLAPALVERLSESTEALKLGGETRRVTIMFSDIAGYTTLSEGMRDKPEQLVDVLNRYFTVLTGVVERHQGYVASFIGDAIMALWGAPASDPEADRNAVAAALDGLAALDAFNRDVVQGEYGLEAIGTRIGVNTGSAVVGNTGSASRLNYTATGDTTNLAARLEGANKLYGTRLMISAETARGLDGTFVLRRIDRLVVKGRSEPIEVYEVVDYRDRVGADALARIADFEAALDQYNQRRFQAAKAVFERLAVDDKAAAVYVERCIHYASEPPSDDWDGSFVSKSK
ncbi:MAG: adenylate/guanylate cyclase domain-containing protein, partial [Rhodospirillales bacterium]